MTCLSDLYYKIGGWFTVVMFGIAIVTLPFAMEVWGSIWSFLMCSGIAFVGAAPNYKGDEHDLHFTAACVSGVCSVIWVSCVSPWWLMLLAVCAVVALIDRVRWLLWCEIGCFGMAYCALVWALV